MADQTTAPQGIAAHPDRLLPHDRELRRTVRYLLESVATERIVSPHGHVDPTILLENRAFSDPAELFISPDHYLTRILHSAGVPLEDLNAGRARGADPQDVWRLLCRHWHLLDGTATGYWLRCELFHVFGIDDARMDSFTEAMDVYDELVDLLRQPEFRPRELFSTFGIDVLATTDDPLDSLEVHAALAQDPTFHGRVLPTFRPDAYINIGDPQFIDRAAALVDAAGEPLTYAGYLRSLAARREHFVSHGAVSSDHGVRTACAEDLSHTEASALFDKGLQGRATVEETLRFEAGMTFRFAEMSLDDGLVMTLHPGVYRNHSESTFRTLGPDTGHDIPVSIEFTRSLRPLLSAYGTDPRLQLILFTIDETTFSRELAPLAGFYPSVYVGAPWWFLDEPDAMRRFREATTGTLGFGKTSGFIDDTRAFCSIPARHDAARRVDAGFLARLVAEHRISLPRAVEAMKHWVSGAPREAFRLEDH